jgi:hypothetical protein
MDLKKMNTQLQKARETRRLTAKEMKMTSDEMLKSDLPQGHSFHNKAKLGDKPDWEIVPKRSPRRMSYDDVFQVITKYAHEMQPYFADGWSRFPQGGNAAMIANYLNDKADFYRTIDTNIANDLIDSATEIIVRCG